MNLTVFLIFVILNVLIYLRYKFFVNKINIYDIPNTNLKIHKKKTPLLGGLIFIINIILLIIINFYFINIFIFENKREYFSFIFLIITFFLLGLYDDKYQVSFLIRIFLGASFALVALLINQNLQIDALLISFYNYEISLYKFSLLFSLFCILIFIHATNMFDGINSQLIVYYLILNTYLFYVSNFNLIYLYLYPLILNVFFLNLKGKIFLGDSGAYGFSSAYSFFIIYEYTTLKNIIYADEILMIMLIPGLELIRLSFTRILNGKNIFHGDLNHLHHLLIKKYGQFKTNLLVTMLIMIPIILMKATKINLYLILIFASLFYFSIIYFLKKK